MKKPREEEAELVQGAAAVNDAGKGTWEKEE